MARCCADDPPDTTADGGSPPGELPDPQSRAVSLAVPLERQLSNMFSTVLTPSGQVSDLAAVAGVELAPEEAVAEYLGELLSAWFRCFIAEAWVERCRGAGQVLGFVLGR